MSAVASITISGIAELRQRLAPDVFRKTLVSALQAALVPVAAGASALAPRRTGRLAGGIRARVSTRGGAITGAIVASVRYGHLVEYGHRQVVGGRAMPAGFTPLSFRARFQGKVTGAVPPHPFARTAFAAQQGTVAHVIETRLAAALTG